MFGSTSRGGLRAWRWLGLAACGAALAAARGQEAAKADAAAAHVPLTKVILYSSGVGFYERAAEIEGDAKVELQFNVDDVNDLLKSMVLQDLGGGTIRAVTYGSRDPITKTLKTFAIDLTKNPTLADLLDQVRGERIELDAPNKIEGLIVGVEKRRREVGERDTVETAFLNLLTDDGLRSVSLDQVGRIKLADPRLDSELRKALATLALAHATDKKTVTLDFAGQGRRPVRVGYVQQSPIWKTSYRLVLSDEGSPLLQGWAIVENTTEEDWNDVRLTLVSGRPVSFVMDLYQPLYLARPIVQPELFASLVPQKYGESLAGEPADAAMAPQALQLGRRMDAKWKAPGTRPAPESRAGGFIEEDRAAADLVVPSEALGITPESIIGQSAAQAAELGALFQYAIEQPVDLPRQQSAMLPIVSGSVEGQRLSIYNAAVHPKHPLAGLRLKNTTGLHLMQGPVTVFDGGAYAGDAQIEDLPPDGQRLVSYAIDLGTEVAPENPQHTSALTTIALKKGTLIATFKLVREVSYRVKNSDKQAKTVIIEQPTEGGWTLVEPKQADEKTRDRYRFAVKAEPGTPTVLPIKEEMTTRQEVSLTDLDGSGIAMYLGAKQVSPEVRKALEELAARNAAIADVSARIEAAEQQIAAIGQEQARIRENMTRLERNSDLYQRYVKKFAAQEDEVETRRREIAELRDEQQRKIDERNAFLMGLDVT